MKGQRAIAYLRVSVVGDREERGRFESPKLQREAIDRWCAQHGVTITGEIFDRNRSGGTMTRKGIQEAMRAVHAGEANGIVVARSDRASRRALHGLQVIEDLEQAGAWIAAADGTIDTTTAQGRMATTMNFAMAENQLDQFRAQAKIVHERAIMRDGRHMGPTPFGYTRDEDNRLTPHPEHAEWLRHIFRSRADGIGWSQIARDIDTAGVRLVTTNGRVTTQQLVRIVKRRVYLGEASHGQWVHENAHPALVDEGLWRAANRARPAVAASPWLTGRKHPESLLRGLLRCSGCRYVLKRLPAEHGKPVRWSCRTLVGGSTHTCDAPARLTGSQGATVERLVIDQFKALAAFSWDEAHPDDDIDGLRRQDAEAEALLDELSSLDVRRELGAARWSKMVAEARAAKEAAMERLASARVRVRPTGDSATIDVVWDAATDEERHAMLCSVVQAVMVDAGDLPAVERVHVLPVWETVDLPRKGVRGFVARPWEPRPATGAGEHGGTDPSEVR